MKYIDADKLIAEIERRLYFDNNWIEGDKKRQMHTSGVSSAYYKKIGSKHTCESILDFITSLQQEQPEAQNGKFVFPKYLYARTKDNKTIDMSYVPQDMTAIEYVRSDLVQQEQPKVDLVAELKHHLATTPKE